MIFRTPERGVLLSRSVWQNENIAMGHALDSPCLRAEGEDTPLAILPNKLLVKLTDSGVGFGVTHVEIAAVGYGATEHVDRLYSAFPRGHGVIEPVNRNTRFEFADTAVGVTTRQHIQHLVKLFTPQVTIGIARPQVGVEFINVPRLHRHH